MVVEAKSPKFTFWQGWFLLLGQNESLLHVSLLPSACCWKSLAFLHFVSTPQLSAFTAVCVLHGYLCSSFSYLTRTSVIALGSTLMQHDLT